MSNDYAPKPETFWLALADRNTPLLLHDNARPYTADKAQKMLEELGINFVRHRAHSADLSPTNYQSFKPLNCISTRTCTERWKDKNVFHPVVLISTNQTHSKDKRKNCNNIILKESSPSAG
ncbi:hypothetical protein M513_05260 [Trichuris suis]|uniref:Uncharacterized protein n=1 Tax=Trichuris suis TaxID=68888 RepID=A0A085M958_9BILA|nr:hypothetical protein M513_05260 [Trichuris suis]